MIEHFKMCRITCDVCGEKHFEVFTFDRSVEAPEGWMNVTSWGWGSTGYSRTRLSCPDCVAKADRDDKVSKPYRIDISLKKDGEGGY